MINIHLKLRQKLFIAEPISSYKGLGTTGTIVVIKSGFEEYLGLFELFRM